MSGLYGLRAGVIGGSYAGLCAGLALRCVGADVSVYERSANPRRLGGGIVVQPDFAEYLEAFGYARPETAAVSTTKRKFLRRDGALAGTSADRTYYTGWDTVLSALREAFGERDLHAGKALSSIDPGPDAVTARFDDGSEERFDLLIAADGIGSTVRRLVEPQIEPRYAGYVGYRGLVPEQAISPDQARLFDDSFVLYDAERTHVLCYFIPGASGEMARGERRFNWVWYVNHSRDQFGDLMRDRGGHRHRSSIGPGEMADPWIESLRDRADRALPALIAEAVVKTEEPFAQGIFDLEVPAMVHGRVVLLGDAAFLVRPHTAAGASKAAADAVALAHTLRHHADTAAGLDSDGLAAALGAWEAERVPAIRRILEHGRWIAARGGLGVAETG